MKHNALDARGHNGFDVFRMEPRSGDELGDPLTRFVRRGLGGHRARVGLLEGLGVPRQVLSHKSVRSQREGCQRLAVDGMERIPA